MEKIPIGALQRTWRKPYQQGARTAVHAYLAGIFDGEGHVIASTTASKPTPFVVVGVTNTDDQPIQLLKRLFGGTITSRQRGLKKDGVTPLKRCYAWRASGKEAHWALSRMLPWLLIKRRKAQLAITMIQNGPSPGYEPTNEERRKALAAYKEFGEHVYVDNPKRYELICVICGNTYFRQKKRSSTCSRHCTGLLREQKKRLTCR